SWFSGDGLHTCWESDRWRRRERDVPYDYDLGRDCRVDVAPNETASLLLLRIAVALLNLRPHARRRRMAAEVGKPAMVVGIDDSEHSFYALQAADVLPFVESDLKKIALLVIERAKDVCSAFLVGDIQYELVEGDPRNALCEAVEKHQAEILVVGSHGYGVIKRSINCILVHGFNALSSHLSNILIDFY
ncbi:hypothetical protein BHE74_00005435, partial [Ensete ventricosum]